LEVTNSAACDFGCSGCGGYGYSDVDYAYSAYPAYGYYAPVYYLPTYAYYPAANYYVGPGYGPAQYAPPVYGSAYQPYLRDYNWRGGYAFAPNVDKHTRIVRIDNRPALRGYAVVKQSRRGLNSIGLGPNTAPPVKKPTTPVPAVERAKLTVDVKTTAFGLKQWPGSPTRLRRSELRPYELAATPAAAGRPPSSFQRSLPAQIGGK
jgi:hypothetical protein